MMISVIMVDGGFRERYHAIDAFTSQTLGPDHYEMLWVEHFSSVSSALLEKVDVAPNARVIQLGRVDEYHASRCFNVGIREAKGEVIVIPDADVMVERDFLDVLWRDHQENHHRVQYFYRFDEPKSASSGAADLKHLKAVCELRNATNFGGCLSVRKKWLEEINGYDEHPVFGGHFHANAYDVNTRLKALGLDVRWSPDRMLYHPYHPFTAVSSSNYQTQHRVIEHRATRRVTLPGEGLVSTKNLAIPDEVLSDAGQPSRWARLRRKMRSLTSRG